MSKNRSGRRFGYLSTSSEDAPTNVPEKQDDASAGLDGQAVDAGGEGEGRSRTRQKRGPSRRKATPVQKLESVPKGQGRMKQARSQLNVRLPTDLKRQATAKAVLEGRDIGEVVEDLLRTYLDK